MTQVVKNRKSTKVVQVISRTQFKADSRKVCYQVRSSDGASQYITCLFNGTATSCTCKATSKCYHMVGCEKLEAAHNAVAEAEQVIKQSVSCQYCGRNHNSSNCNL